MYPTSTNEFRSPINTVTPVHTHRRVQKGLFTLCLSDEFLSLSSINKTENHQEILSKVTDSSYEICTYSVIVNHGEIQLTWRNEVETSGGTLTETEIRNVSACGDLVCENTVLWEICRWVRQWVLFSAAYSWKDYSAVNKLKVVLTKAKA